MMLEAELARGLDALQLPFAADATERLLAFIALIAKWNRVYNLTAVREPERMLTHHVLDSIAVEPYLGEGPLLDIGAGAGLPGIPLAILSPQRRVTLLDSNQKKSAFQKQAAIELKLDNVEVVNARVEDWRPAQRFAVVISRAFSELAHFFSVAAHFCQPGGLLAAMKGAYPGDELAGLALLPAAQVIPLNVPGVDAQRHLVLIRTAEASAR
jgi:16S rRNA (guanine527-N7)-methyltransferase